MWDKLQSSNADVEHEIDVMRRHPAHLQSVLMLCGGDGLSEMRMEHAIARDPRKYLFSFPMLLPIRGEHPHGTTHTLHGGWRLWRTFTKHLCLACGQDLFVNDDFTVSEYKQYDFCLCILMGGVA